MKLIRDCIIILIVQSIGWWVFLITLPTILVKRNCLEYSEHHNNATREWCIASAKANYTFFHSDFTANGKHYAWSAETEQYEEAKQSLGK